jgi:hypothetical protein
VAFGGRFAIAELLIPGGSGGHSVSFSWRFPFPVGIVAQGSITGMGGVDPVADFGFSGVVQNGAFRAIGDDHYGSRQATLAGDGITQVNMEARSFDAWVRGCAVGWWERQ